MQMRDWRNGQTRTFKGRVGDRVSSSLTSRTKNQEHVNVFLFLRVYSTNLAIRLGGILPLVVAFVLRTRLRG